MTFNKFASAVFLCVVTGCALGLSVKVSGLLDESTATVKQSRALIAESRERTNKALDNFNEVLISVKQTSGTLAKASDEQRLYWEKSSRNLDKILIDTRTDLAALGRTIDRANEAIAHTDESINTKVLPAATTSIESTRQIASAAAESIQSVNLELKPVLENAALMSENAAKVLGDPNIQKALQHIEASAANTEEGTAMVVAAEKAALAPASFVRRAIGEAVHLAGRFLGF